MHENSILKEIKDISREIDKLERCINKLPDICEVSNLKEAEKHIDNIISTTGKINGLYKINKAD